MARTGTFKDTINKIGGFFSNLRFLSFFFPFLTVAVTFAMLGVHPAGDKTMLTVDLYHQYMPFIYELRAKILEGRSLFYSWNGGLGNEFYAVYANYCASPLNIFALLFPYKTLPVFVALITAVRAGLASSFMSKFLSYIDDRHYDLVTVCFGIAYALCGWFLTDFWNIMWCDAYVLLPLICLGLLKLFIERRFELYVITLAVALISNYYAGYMLCIFLVPFSIVAYFAFIPKERLGVKSFFASAGRFALGSVIAGAISAVVVIPTYLILQNSSATGDEFPVDFSPTMNLFDFLARFFVSANPNIRGGLANVACGTVAVLMLPLFFMAVSNSGITLRKKIGFGFMLAFLYLSFATKTLNFIWHGFHFPNQIPYRQSYMMSFVVIIMAFMTIRVLKTFTRGQLTAVCVSAAVYLLLFEKFGSGDEGYQQIGLSLLFLLIQAFVLRAVLMSKGEKTIVLQAVLSVTMLLETATASGFTIARVAEHEGFTGYDYYGKNRQIIHEHALAVEGSAGHQNFERTELYPNFICDIQSVYDVKGMSVFSSTARESFVKYMRNFGFHNNGINGLRNAGLTRVTAALLGIRGLTTIQHTASIPLLYEATNSEGEVIFYDNPDALSVGYMVSDDIINYAPNSAITDVFNKTNDWVRAMGLEADVYIPLYISSSEESGITFMGQSGNGLNYEFENTGSKSNYTVTVYTADIGADVYVYADCSKGGRARIGANSEDFEIRSYQTIYLGKYTGEPLSCTITYNDSPSGSLHVYAYELNNAAYDQMIDLLSQRQLNVTYYDDTSIHGTIDAGEGGFLFLTIPYTDGFTVTVDGEQGELVPVQDALCGIYLESGSHEIVLKYQPAAFVPSLIISIAGLLVLAAVITITKLNRMEQNRSLQDPSEEIPVNEDKET
ncbi:MAG: YfhO family protein [Clostridiales bacterium]|nr:YfhO family protein [Clostridiales bacterium]